MNLLGMSESAIARAGIGRKFQKPTVFEDQTVRENLAMALRNKRGPFDVLFYRPTARRARASPSWPTRSACRRRICPAARAT